MKKLGICGFAAMLLIFLLPVSTGYAAEHEINSCGVYRMSAEETKAQAEEAVRRLALRHAVEEAADYILGKSEYDNGSLEKDEIYALAGQVLKVKHVDYDWHVVGNTGTLEVKAALAAVLDEKTVDARLLELTHKRQMEELRAHASKEKDSRNDSREK